MMQSIFERRQLHLLLLVFKRKRNYALSSVTKKQQQKLILLLSLTLLFMSIPTLHGYHCSSASNKNRLFLSSSSSSLSSSSKYLSLFMSKSSRTIAKTAYNNNIPYGNVRRRTTIMNHKNRVYNLQFQSKDSHTIPLSQITGLSMSTTASGNIVNDDNTNNEKDDEGDSGNVILGVGTATIPYHVFNLIKAIIGAGVLSLPSGIATYGIGYKSAIIPAIALITFIGIMSGYGFTLIGHVCYITNTTSYRDAWIKSINKQTSWIPAISVTLKTIFAILAYSMILKDTIYSLIVTYIPSITTTATAGTAASILTLSRNGCLLLLSSIVLLPLCLLKDLKSLAPFSLMGVIGMFYTTIAIIIRYYDQSYRHIIGGSMNNFLVDLPTFLQPSFATTAASVAGTTTNTNFMNGIVSVLTPQTSILLAMLSTAYMAHFNAPKFYKELYNNTMKRYNIVVRISFGISILLTILISCYGYITFGNNCSGLILNNYSYHDILISISRIAVAISLIFSYPLAFTGAKDGIIDLLRISKNIQSNTIYMNLLSITLLSVVTIMAIITPDVSFVMALAGATLGNGLIYIFPGLMYRGAIRKMKNPSLSQKRQVPLALASACMGTALGILGAMKAIQRFC